jgi:hypothetical protein
MRSLTEKTIARPRAPWRLLLVVAGLALALCLFLALRDTFDPLRRQAAQREETRAAQLDEQLTTIDLFAAAIWRLAPALLDLPLASLGLYLLGAIAWRRWGDYRSIEAHYQVQAIRAANPVLPSLANVTYGSARTNPMPPALIALPDEVPTLAPTFPTFGELLDQGRIGIGRALIMGWTPPPASRSRAARTICIAAALARCPVPAKPCC